VEKALECLFHVLGSYSLFLGYVPQWTMLADKTVQYILIPGDYALSPIHMVWSSLMSLWPLLGLLHEHNNNDDREFLIFAALLFNT
jgi:hypothetical protein